MTTLLPFLPTGRATIDASWREFSWRHLLLVMVMMAVVVVTAAAVNILMMVEVVQGSFGQIRAGFQR